MVSLIASVETNLTMECSLAMLTAVVDLPTPVAPAIIINSGGFLVTFVLVESAMLTVLAIRSSIPFYLIKTFVNRRGFEAVPTRLEYDERTDVDCR